MYLNKSIMEKAIILDSVNSKINIYNKILQPPWSGIYFLYGKKCLKKIKYWEYGRKYDQIFLYIHEAYQLIDYIIKNIKKLKGKL